MDSLDAQELLHLGLHAAQHDDPRQAIDCLKRCLELEPSNPKATYLLGSLYAQIGLYDRAKEALTEAVRLDKSEYTAIFQLGLLHLTSGAVDLSSDTWRELDQLPKKHCLNLFREGLLALVNDDFAGCMRLLEEGIAANTLNEPLNNDMRNVRASAEAALARSATSSTADSPKESSAGEGHHLLGGYLQQRRH